MEGKFKLASIVIILVLGTILLISAGMVYSNGTSVQFKICPESVTELNDPDQTSLIYMVQSYQVARVVGHPWSFLLITLSQWTWIMGFLFLVEEKELAEKFGEQYKAYRQQVSMFFPNPLCILRILSKPIEMPEG